jgi:hypothetical protein
MDGQTAYRVDKKLNVAAAFERFSVGKPAYPAAAAFKKSLTRTYFLAYLRKKALISSMRS